MIKSGDNMKLAADFRAMARETLQGKWTIAVLVGLVAAILSGLEGMGPELKLKLDGANSSVSFKFIGQTIFSTSADIESTVGVFFVGSFIYMMLTALVIGTIYLILSSVVRVGYAKFNLNLTDRLEADFENLFAYFSYWKTTALAKFFRMSYVLFWSFLFIIPGIIASFSYAMTDYILCENPELTASEALNKSKEMMVGNRWRLFCLKFSFIGWNILCSFTLGIGHLWLTPYKQAAEAAFYREVSGTERRNYEDTWSEEPVINIVEEV